MPSPYDKFGAKTTPLGCDGAAADHHGPAAATAAVVTYAAVPTKSHVIGGVAWSYSAAPTGGNLKIEDEAGTVIFEMAITAAGHGFIPFTPPKRGRVNKAMIITLASGAGAVVGKINILGHWLE